MKRTAGSSGDDGSGRDTRPLKLKTDHAGRVVTSKQTATEKKQDSAVDDVAAAIGGLASELDDDKNGYGQELWNNSTMGPALHRLGKAIQSHPDKYPLDAATEGASRRPDATSTRNLTEADVKMRLAKGIVEDLQDPEYYPAAEEHPILQVNGMRFDCGGSVASHGRQISTITLTLVDGSGLLISARVAVTENAKAGGLRKGYLIKLKRFHRIHIARFDDIYSTAGIGLMEFDVVGVGPQPNKGEYIAADRLDTADLVNKVGGNSEGISSEQIDPLHDWDDNNRRPPIPETRCTRNKRTCSRYGSHFFRKCICEEIPVRERNLEKIADAYWATDKPVAEMSKSEIRNMLYWSYATDVYHVRGWLNRMPLPPCLVFEIRKLHPNKKDEPYVEYHENNTEV